MKRFQTIGLALAVVLIFQGCGSSTLSEAEKKAAAATVASLSSTATSRLNAAIRQARENRTCTPGEVSAAGFTFKTECPTATQTKFTITAAGPATRTCGTETVTVKDILSVILYSVDSTTMTMNLDLSATANEKAVVCKFDASVNLSTGASTYSDSSFACSYNGVALTKTDLALVSCATR